MKKERTSFEIQTTRAMQIYSTDGNVSRTFNYRVICEAKLFFLRL